MSALSILFDVVFPLAGIDFVSIDNYNYILGAITCSAIYCSSIPVALDCLKSSRLGKVFNLSTSRVHMLLSARTTNID